MIFAARRLTVALCSDLIRVENAPALWKGENKMTSLHPAEHYEDLAQMSRDDILETLQLAYEANIKCTNYDGQPDYVGDGADYLAYAVAQGISQAMEMLMNMWDFLDEMKGEEGT
jgi:hypothetical protein